MIGARHTPPHPVKRRRVDKSVKLKKGDVCLIRLFVCFYFAIWEPVLTLLVPVVPLHFILSLILNRELQFTKSRS